MRLTATANDILLQNVKLIPLQVATPAPSAAKTTAKPALITPSGLPPSGEQFTATKQRSSFTKLVAAFFLAVLIVLIVARAFGMVAVRVGQPRVMGEVIAGIALGPSLFGLVAPNLQATIFSTDILPAFGVAANLGLIFFMFLIGMEVDQKQLKGKRPAAAISNASIALPMLLGIAAALPLYKLLGPDIKFAAFALFMGVAMSITAFPVLARILTERRMLKGPVGSLTIGCAAIDDVSAWFDRARDHDRRLRLVRRGRADDRRGGRVRARDGAGGAPGPGAHGDRVRRGRADPIRVVCRDRRRRAAVGVHHRSDRHRRDLRRLHHGDGDAAARAPDRGGHAPGRGFRRHSAATDVLRLHRPEYNITLLDRPELWLITAASWCSRSLGKLAGAAIAARVCGFDSRASMMIGTLMNTRGLTELIVLNIALEVGAISSVLFTALVVMAIITTLMTGPMLKLLDPRNEYGTKIEDELAGAAPFAAREHPGLPVAERSILVAAHTDAALERLI